MAPRWRLFLLLAAGCGEPARPEAVPAAYVVTPVETMLEGVKDARGGAATLKAVSDAVRAREEEPAANALWTSVSKARSKGLLEICGVEYFGIGEPTYEALLFVRTREGCACLYAAGELHGQRVNALTVPSHVVAPTAFERLLQRVELELPLPRKVALGWSTVEGAVVRLHLLRDGRSTTILWHLPEGACAAEERSAIQFQFDYPVDSILRALWAAAPPALFCKPGETREEAYRQRPGY